MSKASWFGEPSRLIIKLDLLSFRILAQVEVMVSRLCGISNKSFDFTLCPIVAVTSITCSIRTMPAPTLGLPFAAQHQNHACPQSGFESNRALVGRTRKKTQIRPRTITTADLSIAFLRIWAAIPLAFINRLIHSMYRRCVSVINAHGGHTRY